MLAVLGVLNSVVLPRGVTDLGEAGTLYPWPLGWWTEATYWVTLRDHTNKIFYYRTANSYLFRAVDLGAIDWSKLAAAAAAGRMPASPLRPPKQPGVLDVTASFLRE